MISNEQFSMNMTIAAFCDGRSLSKTQIEVIIYDGKINVPMDIVSKDAPKIRKTYIVDNRGNSVVREANDPCTEPLELYVKKQFHLPANTYQAIARADHDHVFFVVDNGDGDVDPDDSVGSDDYNSIPLIDKLEFHSKQIHPVNLKQEGTCWYAEDLFVYQEPTDNQIYRFYEDQLITLTSCSAPSDLTARSSSSKSRSSRSFSESPLDGLSGVDGRFLVEIVYDNTSVGNEPRRFFTPTEDESKHFLYKGQWFFYIVNCNTTLIFDAISIKLVETLDYRAIDIAGTEDTLMVLSHGALYVYAN